MTSVADKLREARALIERGWTRGELERGGRVCVLGAIHKATQLPDDDWFLSPPNLRLRCWETFAIAAGVNSRPFCIANWNDKQPSKKPVLATFDKAIELAEKEPVQ
jgi:hypothetical protein